MEHRWTERHPVRMNAVLRYDGVGLITGKIRDISFGGAFVETGAPSFLPRNAMLQVALAKPTSAGTAPTHLRAVVARCAHDGVGLMFTDFEPETLSALRCVIAGTPASNGDGGTQTVAAFARAVRHS